MKIFLWMTGWFILIVVALCIYCAIIDRLQARAWRRRERERRIPPADLNQYRKTVNFKNKPKDEEV